MENTKKTAGKTATEGVGLTETQTIKARIHQAKTWGDGQEIVDSFTGEQLLEFRDALQIVNDNFGLTMRDEFMLSLIKHKIDERARSK